MKEEVGITVENIQYFGSQPWPFPNSLMIGFTAEYAAGEIRIDSKELTDAGWFDKENLPQVPAVEYRRTIDRVVCQEPLRCLSRVLHSKV